MVFLAAVTPVLSPPLVMYLKPPTIIMNTAITPIPQLSRLISEVTRLFSCTLEVSKDAAVHEPEPLMPE